MNTATKRIIDLKGSDGNAFVLLGIAEDIMLDKGYTEREVAGVLNHMKASDYKHLLKVFRQHCGDSIVFAK